MTLRVALARSDWVCTCLKVVGTWRYSRSRKQRSRRASPEKQCEAVSAATEHALAVYAESRHSRQLWQSGAGLSTKTAS